MASPTIKYIHNHIALFCCIVLLGYSCAQVGTPSGGPADIIAPKLDTANSSPNKQTNYTDREIILTFDEWIEVSNATKEVFISPPLDYLPKISSRGKTIKLKFADEEKLKDNTTYQINFGKSIKDLTAGNTVENFIFLFSTGPVIDKLSIMGQVTDSQTGKAMPDIIISLYDNLSDTCFTEVKPLYLTRTDKEGQYELNNLRADTFQLFALKDENVSYTYDLPTEQVSYFDSLIILIDTPDFISDTPIDTLIVNNVDTLETQLKYNLKLFDEEDPPRLIEVKQKQRGLITLIFQPMPQNPKITYLANDLANDTANDIANDMDSETLTQFQEITNDTIIYWHTDLDADSARITVQYANVLDTIALKSGNDTIAKRSLKCLDKTLQIKKKDTLFIKWNKPIDRLDIEKISIADTSGVRPILEGGQTGKATWLIADLAPASNYTVNIDSAAVTDWYGQTNRDSLVLILKTFDPETFGNINLIVDKEDSLRYEMTLFKGEEKINNYKLTKADTLEITALNPGKYKLKVIQDLNKDGRWTTGSIAEKRRPEKIKELTLEDLKPGWDLEATLDIQQLFYGAESK